MSAARDLGGIRGGVQRLRISRAEPHERSPPGGCSGSSLGREGRCGPTVAGRRLLDPAPDLGGDPLGQDGEVPGPLTQGSGIRKGCREIPNETKKDRPTDRRVGGLSPGFHLATRRIGPPPGCTARSVGPRRLIRFAGRWLEETVEMTRCEGTITPRPPSGSWEPPRRATHVHRFPGAYRQGKARLRRERAPTPKGMAKGGSRSATLQTFGVERIGAHPPFRQRPT
jgi:hypothetical protein